MGFNVSSRILVSDPLAEDGLGLLRSEFQVDVKTDLPEEELIKIIGEYDALLVRSGTEVTAKVIDAGKKLRFIGRAGAGVDNIDMDAATRRGIIVANAPEGNTLAATEHTMAMMLSLARNIPQANASLKRKEWKRSKFMGVELNEKTLGIVGLGRIGREIAKRANAMGMHCAGYDPFISKDRAAQMGVECGIHRGALQDLGFHHGPYPSYQGDKAHHQCQKHRHDEGRGQDHQLCPRGHHR